MPPVDLGKLKIIARRKGIGRVIGFDLEKGVGGGYSDAREPTAFVRGMKPSQFLGLASPLQPDEPIGYIPKQLQKGRASWDRDKKEFVYDKENPYWQKNTLNPPLFWTRYSPDFDAHFITGHEGRHRSAYLSRSGDPVIPVVVKPSENLRKQAEIPGFRRKVLIPQQLSADYSTARTHGILTAQYGDKIWEYLDKVRGK